MDSIFAPSTLLNSSRMILRGENGMNFELTHERQVAGRLNSKQRKHEIDDDMRNF